MALPPCPSEVSRRNPSILVIGYGNTLRRDDAVGRLAAETVASWGLPGISVHSTHQLEPELAGPISRAGLVVFIDAFFSAGGSQAHPGVRVTPVTPSGNLLATHAADPAGLLQLASGTFGTCPPAWLVAIPASDLGFGDGLSRQAWVALEEAVAAVAGLVAGHFRSRSGG